MPIDPDMHLKRHCGCVDCKWQGFTGRLIARDKLRCPRCDSDYILYYTLPAPASVQ
jgi:hypothetical protein